MNSENGCLSHKTGEWQGAPLDGGVVFILLTAVAYAGRKIYFLRKKVN
jgi:hypothetical protein